MYDIRVGDEFWRDTFSVRKGLALPEKMIITKIGDDYFEAGFKYRTVDTRHRRFSLKELDYSNLNPKCERPDWIFERPQILQAVR